MAKGQKKGRGRGRPPLHPGESKRGSFNTRLRNELKSELQKHAGRAGRSLSEEIEYRLEQSFGAPRDLSASIALAVGPQAAALIALLIQIVRYAAGRNSANLEGDWLGNAAAFDDLLVAVSHLLRAIDPASPAEGAIVQGFVGSLIYELCKRDAAHPNAAWHSELRERLGERLMDRLAHAADYLRRTANIDEEEQDQ